jgi:homoserine dehydrogenase
MTSVLSTGASAAGALRPSLAPRGGPAGANDVRHVRLAVAGCGVVGGALLQALQREQRELAGRHGITIELVRVLVRDCERPRDVTFGAGILTNNLDTFLESEADIVVEAIGGIDPARRIAANAIGRGAHIITANKALLAERGGELASLARRRGVTLRCDASVGGGVPVLRLIDSALGGCSPRRVRAILNGTSNYVLTLLEQGATLGAALEQARHRGFAEADATRDLDGRDAADKLAIVAWAAFGIDPEHVIVRRRGLLPDPERLVHLATAAGGRLRLIAECERVGETDVVASVEPVIVRAESAFGRTVYEENRVELHGGWSSPLSASGPGAGGAPTATALLSDLLATVPLLRDKNRGGWQARQSAGVSVEDDREFRWAIGLPLGAVAALSSRASARDLQLDANENPDKDSRRSLADARDDKGGVIARENSIVVTTRCSWATVAAVIETLGDEVVIARLDDERNTRRTS